MELVNKIPEFLREKTAYFREMKQVKVFLNFTIQADLTDNIDLTQLDKKNLVTKKAKIFTNSIDFIRLIQGMTQL